jgi:hypothetical protein
MQDSALEAVIVSTARYSIISGTLVGTLVGTLAGTLAGTTLAGTTLAGTDGTNPIASGHLQIVNVGVVIAPSTSFRDHKPESLGTL